MKSRADNINTLIKSYKELSDLFNKGDYQGVVDYQTIDCGGQTPEEESMISSILELRARSYSYVGNYQEAIKNFNLATEKNKKLSSSDLQLNSFMLQCHLAEAYELSGNIAQAVKNYGEVWREWNSAWRNLANAAKGRTYSPGVFIFAAAKLRFYQEHHTIAVDQDRISQLVEKLARKRQNYTSFPRTYLPLALRGRSLAEAIRKIYVDFYGLLRPKSGLAMTSSCHVQSSVERVQVNEVLLQIIFPHIIFLNFTDILKKEFACHSLNGFFLAFIWSVYYPVTLLPAMHSQHKKIQQRLLS